MAVAIADAITQVLEEFGEMDFWVASRTFWQTIRQSQKVNQGLAKAVFIQRGELLTLTLYIDAFWKGH